MSQMSSIEATGGVDAAAAQDASLAAENQSQSKGSTGDVVNVPSEPAAPSDASFLITQTALGQHVQGAHATGAKSSFRLLLEAGHANVNGWWGRTGKLNYARKCLTDIPIGLMQGVLCGLLAGFRSLVMCSKDKFLHPENTKDTSLLSYFGDTQKDALKTYGLTMLANADIENRAYRAGIENTGKAYTRDMTEFTQGVKDHGDVIYTPSEVFAHGLGAAVGAAVPTVLAAIFFGPSALYMAAKEKMAGGETPPSPVAGPPVAEDPEQVEHSEMNAHEPSAE